MKHFIGITDLEQAKQRFRILAKQLHPDAGGTAQEFQEMQDEYKIIVERLQRNHTPYSYEQPKPRTKHSCNQNESPEKELLNSLGKLAKVLIKKQVPQNYLRQKITTTNSPLKKDILSELVNILDEL